MKKILAIVVLGLLWNGNVVFGYDIPEIKVKNLKCLHKEYKKEGKTKKEDHLYIIFSDDKKTAIMAGPVDKGTVNVYKRKLRVSVHLSYIDFGSRYDLSEWSLNRKTGQLQENLRKINQLHETYGICEPVEKGFEPLKYLENVAKENLERTKKELKF